MHNTVLFYCHFLFPVFLHYSRFSMSASTQITAFPLLYITAALLFKTISHWFLFGLNIYVVLVFHSYPIPHHHFFNIASRPNYITKDLVFYPLPKSLGFGGTTEYSGDKWEPINTNPQLTPCFNGLEQKCCLDVSKSTLQKSLSKLSIVQL